MCPNCHTFHSFIAHNVTPKASAFYIGSNQALASITDIAQSAPSNSLMMPSEFSPLFERGAPRGCTILFSGDPGCGKSTLCLQLSGHFAQQGFKSIYVAGEEPATSIRDRAQRIDHLHPHISVLCEQNIVRILDVLKRQTFDFLIVDSVSSLFHPNIRGKQETILRSISELNRFCKEKQVVVFLISHVTKDHPIAGPKEVEHLVDMTLFLEKQGETRILRSPKSRIGSTNNSIFLEMTDKGLVVNPSKVMSFLISFEPSPGACISLFSKKDKHFIVEVQVLTQAQKHKGRRSCVGYPVERLDQIEATLRKHGRFDLDLSKHDIFVSIQGGMFAETNEVDSAVVFALLSSLTEKTLFAKKVALIGEIELNGRIRETDNVREKRQILRDAGCEKLLECAHIQDIVHLFE